MSSSNSTPQTLLAGITHILVDGFNTLFPLPYLDPVRDLHALLCALELPVSMDKFWPVYDELQKLDYRGEIESADRWSQLLERLGIESSPTLIGQLSQCEYDSYSRFTRLYGQRFRFYRGAREFVETANKAGFETILYSNTTATGWRLEQDMGLPELFGGRCLVSSEEGVVKQVEDGQTVHDTMLGQWLATSAVSPSAILVVDDEIRYLEVAKELGCHTALTVQGRPEAPKPERLASVDLVVSSLLQILSHVIRPH